MEAKQTAQISYTPITETSSTDTLTITEADLPDNIDVTASSTSQNYVLDRTNGLELDYSGLTATSCTTTFAWSSSASHEVSIVEGSTTLTTLGPTNTSYDYELDCGQTPAELDLIVGDAAARVIRLGNPTDPKIKIVPPSCA
jgi:hypothetical protein